MEPRDYVLASDGLETLGIKKMNWCGLSMGGMVGMWLGANVPDRINKLILSNTSAYYADKTPWNDRIKTVREKGLKSIVNGNMERWFTKDFRDRAPQALARMSEMFLSTPLSMAPRAASAAADASPVAVTSKVTMGSSACAWSRSSVRMGSPNSMIHLLGSGMRPSGPSQGNSGVIGMYGTPSSRASAGTLPTRG